MEGRGAVRRRARRRALAASSGDIFGRLRRGGRDRAPEVGVSFTPAVRVLAPVVPGKIVAIGLNYKDHAAEQGKPLPIEPMIFLKPSTAVIAPGDADPPARRASAAIDHEAEMAIVIGRRATCVPAAAARGAHPGRDVRQRRDRARHAEPRRAALARARASTRSARSARASPSASIPATSPSKAG
ncbi:MAG: fumarylacetoacetate hydrolase family protein [Ignavibacteriales bacterium]|nr:fumarylacetoacetate hydrolase family protein [Ignavibacteriales bacterium]